MKGYTQAFHVHAQLVGGTPEQSLAEAIESEPPGCPHSRANAMTAFYTAAQYNSWFDGDEEGLPGVNEYRLRCWAQILNDPWLTQDLVELAVHTHMQSTPDRHMLPADVRVTAALLRLEREANNA